MRLRHAFAALAIAAALVVAVRAGLEATPEGGRVAAPAPLLGVTDYGGERRLVRVAPVSLRPLPGRGLRLQEPLDASALSPDGSRLAGVGARASTVHLIDLERMQTLGHVRTQAHGSPAAVMWPREDRLWLVLARPACCAIVVIVDPIAERVVARRRLAGGIARVAASPEGPVLLLAPAATLGPARLATVDAAGAVEEVALDGVSAGAMPTEVVPSVERVRMPALAVDPLRRRAYVLSSRPYALEIDLRRLRVSHHRLAPRASPLDRLRELLEPSAHANTRVGPVRDAAWIGQGRIAFSGYDADVVWRPDDAVERELRPAGLHVVDTHDWSVRTLDDRASAFVAAAGLLLTGGRGLTAYAPDGPERFHVLGDRQVEIAAVAGSLAYVRTPPESGLQVVDLARGRVIGTSAAGRAALLPAGRGRLQLDLSSR